MINNYNESLKEKKNERKILDSDVYSHNISDTKNIEYRRIRITSSINNNIAANVVDFIKDINIYDQKKLQNINNKKDYYKKILKNKNNFSESLIQDIYLKQISLKDYKINPINIYLSTPGGSVMHGFEIIDAIRLSKTPVHIFATGRVSSMGIAILLSGHKRIGSKYCRFMMHDINGHLSGKLHEMEDSIYRTKLYKNLLHNLYKEKSKINMDFLNKIYDNNEDYYFYSEEALKLGIIDEIK